MLNINTILLIIIYISSLGCTNSLKTEVAAKIPDHGIRSLVLLNENKYNSMIRRSLIKNGFRVKAQPNIYNVTNKSESRDISYNKFEANFGLRHSGRLSGNNPCITNGNAFHFTEYEFELIDLRTNDTILFISKGGWTEWCTGAPTFNTTDLFGDLAKELSNAIKKNK